MQQNRPFEEIVAKVRARDIYYGTDRNSQTILAFDNAGAERSIIACGGFRLLVQHYDSILISIMPKASSAGRGEYVLWTGQSKDSWIVNILNREYYYDRMGPSRLHEALHIAKIAWETSDGNIEQLHKAIGARGFCAICGAGLSDELSIARGIGPECIKKVHYTPVITHLQKHNLSKQEELEIV
jgi:hypothetical protein